MWDIRNLEQERMNVMQAINIANCKKCVICKYWYDPTNASINPKAPQMNLWEFDDKVKRMCLRKGVTVSPTGICETYVGKLEIL